MHIQYNGRLVHCIMYRRLFGEAGSLCGNTQTHRCHEKTKTLTVSLLPTSEYKHRLALASPYIHIPLDPINRQNPACEGHIPLSTNSDGQLGKSTTYDHYCCVHLGKAKQ